MILEQQPGAVCIDPLPEFRERVTVAVCGDLAGASPRAPPCLLLSGTWWSGRGTECISSERSSLLLPLSPQCESSKAARKPSIVSRVGVGLSQPVLVAQKYPGSLRAPETHESDSTWGEVSCLAQEFTCLHAGSAAAPAVNCPLRRLHVTLPGAAQARPCPCWVLRGTHLPLAASPGPLPGFSVGLPGPCRVPAGALSAPTPLGPEAPQLVSSVCPAALRTEFCIRAAPGRVPAQASLPRSFRIPTSCSRSCL